MSWPQPLRSCRGFLPGWAMVVVREGLTLVGLKGCLEGGRRGLSNQPGSLAPFSATRERELLTLGERVWTQHRVKRGACAAIACIQRLAGACSCADRPYRYSG